MAPPGARPGARLARPGRLIRRGAAAFVLACVGAWLGVATLDSWLLGVILAIGCASTVPALTAMPGRRRSGGARPAEAGAWTVRRLLRGGAVAVVVIAAAALVALALGLRDGDLAAFVLAVAAGAGAAAAGGPPRR